MSAKTATCIHCARPIVYDEDAGWIDPEATGGDSVWRASCDGHDTLVAEHEPRPQTASETYRVAGCLEYDGAVVSDVDDDSAMFFTVYERKGDDGTPQANLEFAISDHPIREEAEAAMRKLVLQAWLNAAPEGVTPIIDRIRKDRREVLDRLKES